MASPRKPRAEGKEQVLGVRVTQTDLDRLDRFVARTGEAVSRSSLARAAMRIGLDVLEKSPSKLVELGDKSRG